MRNIHVQTIPLWHVCNQPKRPFFLYSALGEFSMHYFVVTDYVVKEWVQAFSCVYIELWMHLGSLENSQEARVALD